MYGPPSPIFDVPIPELPILRRVKPLPKRRRTSDPVPHGGDGGVATPLGQQHTEHSNEAEEPASGAPAQTTQDPSLAAQMALQAYYMPVLGGVRDLFKTAADDGQSRTSTPIGVDLNAALAVAGLGTRGMGYGGMYGLGGGQDDDDDDGGDGDYVDHLQQPGNTKKRKVPANMSGSAHGHNFGSGAEDESFERGGLGGRERDLDTLVGGAAAGGTQPGMLAGKKVRLRSATLAGLQHKETLKNRKRQVVSVLDVLTHDTLALDEALSTNRVFVPYGVEPRIRLSRRRTSRITRALKAYKESHAQAEQDENKPPSCDFTFVWHNATSDRFVATREEVAILHSRFEAELARQAVKAAEAAKQAAAAAALTGALAKRTERTKQVARTAKDIDQKGVLEQSLLGTTGKGGKKKKRSALANASNPHHLRNYVPSRLPHNGPPSGQQASQNAQNLLTPQPLRFLSAEVPPRRRKKSEPNVTSISTLTNAGDEWICPFCEYELFYGDEQSYHRAVRSRKKILRRRRRARERAAAAASGVAPGAAAAGREKEEDVHGEFESPAGAPVPKESASVGGKQARLKEGDRGGVKAAEGVSGGSRQ